ncbi:DAK2 domain-containing protein [Lachnotalea glycerini]|uniref:DAK2 domain-containing protein n=1 Tax=Lachnotalea glycerini TaxID=1763509 RepID=A0A371JJ39_9FIRM|nr:DAK2 domain-containing protein [Lachnotalea glycerini]RDY32739.1 DAK2 domain-containing protein [Lachnotalea glycerini]
MTINRIDAEMLSKMFLAGAKNIEAKKEWINELNVFPVPDGDTGTNMSLTIMAAAREVSTLNNPSMAELAKAISSGSLRGARGNSGVILSQLFRGFTKVIKEYDEIDKFTITNAFSKAVETAYKAVMKPKEGTILTVAKGMADKCVEIVDEVEDLEEFIRQVIEHGDYVLSQTPEMLPVLKQAGVVDSGGQGLMQVLKGGFDAFLGKEVDLSIQGSNHFVINKSSATVEETADIKFGYCTEFIVMLDKEYTMDTEHEFKEFLGSIGDSLVVVSDEDIVKVHVHTNDPGLAIQKGLTYGSLTSMKIDNMREEHHERLIKDAEKLAKIQAQEMEKTPKKEVGFIAVSIGQGINEIFQELGVDYLIEGGQTMNPSTEDMLNAIDKVNADNIFILPNNKNIILAANQAKELIEDKNIIVIPTKTVPQGITAVINYVLDKSVEDNEKSMLEEIARVKTGQVTYAVRDTNIDGKEIKENDIMGIGDHSILTVGRAVEKVTKDMLKELVDDESELISIYYGEDISEDIANKLAEEITNEYKNCEVEIHFGGQPIYYYIVSVE